MTQKTFWDSYEEEFYTPYAVESYQGPPWKDLMGTIYQRPIEHPDTIKAAERLMACLGLQIKAKVPGVKVEDMDYQLGYVPVLSSIGIVKPRKRGIFVVRVLWTEDSTVDFHWGTEEDWAYMSYDDRKAEAGEVGPPFDLIVRAAKKFAGEP